MFARAGFLRRFMAAVSGGLVKTHFSRASHELVQVEVFNLKYSAAIALITLPFRKPS